MSKATEKQAVPTPRPPAAPGNPRSPRNPRSPHAPVGRPPREHPHSDATSGELPAAAGLPEGGGSGGAEWIEGFFQWQCGSLRGDQQWSPALNLFSIPGKQGGRLVACMDLAGVDRNRIEVRVEPGRLLIRGYRHPPEPPRSSTEQLRIVSMEIDHGPFSREIPLPELADLSTVTSKYRDGLLWIEVPLRSPRPGGG